MRQTNPQGGYTLIELLLYVAIVGSLLVALVAFLGLSLEGRVKSQSISEVNQQGAATMEYITQALRNASSITAPAAGSSATTLTIAMPTTSLNPTIISLSGSTMTSKEGSAAALALTNDQVTVSNVSFTNVSRSGTEGAMRVSFTLSRVNNSSRNEYNYTKTFTTTVTLR